MKYNINKIIIIATLLFVSLALPVSAQNNFANTYTSEEYFEKSANQANFENNDTWMTPAVNVKDAFLTSTEYNNAPFENYNPTDEDQENIFRAPPPGAGNPQKIPIGEGLPILLVLLGVYFLIKRRLVGLS